MQPQETIQRIRTELEVFPTPYDQFEYLCEVHGQLPEPGGIRVDANRLKGCQSDAWMRCRMENGSLSCEAYGTAMGVRVTLGLLCQILNGATAEEIQALQWEDIQQIPVFAQLTPQRRGGVHSALEKARACLPVPA